MNKLNNQILPVLVTIILSLTAPVIFGADYYVDEKNGDDSFNGNSWQTATRHIQVVMDRLPEPGDTVHVAEGTYPEEITLVQGVNLLGGYPAGGGQRNPDAYLSIIDGENSHRCVIGADNALLDGFTIENGTGRSGGGILNSRVTMHINNCIITHCTATAGTPFGGGAIYFYLSDSLVSNCVFIENTCYPDPESAAGEAMGGAIMLWTAGARIVNCSFFNNSVPPNELTELRLGGAIWASASNHTIRGCYFQENSAVTGGAMGWWNRCEPLVENCQFVSNTADSIGGGIAHIFNENHSPDSDLWIRNCVFDSNNAEYGGGLLVTRNNRVRLDNNLFINNTASINGSGMAVMESYCAINHCTFSGNRCVHSDNSGACVYLDANSEVELLNTIIAENSSIYALEMESGGDPLMQKIRFCNIWEPNMENMYSSNLVDRTGWQGNVSVDPVFISSETRSFCLSEPATGDPFQIDLGKSPCIDSGENPVTGYHQQYQSTRTDGEVDTEQVDMGWHQISSGAQLIADSPFAGEFNVAVNSSLSCHLVEMPSGVNEEDITFTLNNQSIPFEMQSIHEGFRCVLSPANQLATDTLYTVRAVIEFSFGSRELSYQFSTSPWQTPPSPPEGTCFQLEYPIEQTAYGSGDELNIVLELYNPWLNSITSDLHIVFEYQGAYYIFPTWDMELHPVRKSLDPGEFSQQEVLSFQVPPSLELCGPFVFYALGTIPGTLTPVGDLAIWSMEFI